MGSLFSTTLYHYTNSEGYKGIEAAGKIKASTLSGRDAVYGEGVYFTSLAPSTSTKTLLQNNWPGMHTTKEDVEYYIEIDSSDLPNVEQMDDGDRDVWLVPHDVVLSKVSYETGRR